MESNLSPISSVKDAVYKLQLSLLDGVRHESQLSAAGSLMSRSDYEDVVTERSISNVCGYPLCPNPLPTDLPSRKGRYRISLKEHKVYDLTETRLYCSPACVVNSKAFAASLQDERCSVSDSGKIAEVLKLFGELGLEEKDEKKKSGKLGLKDLKICEKTEVKTGEVSLEDWIGPSNAIEGYVPRLDYKSSPLRSKHLEKGSKGKELGGPERGEGMIANGTDFMSTIIIGDQFTAPKETSGNQKKYSERRVNKKPQGTVSADTVLKSDKTQSNSRLKSLEELEKSNETKLKSALKSSEGMEKSNETKLISALKSSEEMEKSNETKLISTLKSSEEMEKSNETKLISALKSSEEMEKSNGAQLKSELKSSEEMEKSNTTQLRSALKSSGSKTLSRNVTWADEKELDSSAAGNLCNVKVIEDKYEKSGISGVPDVEDGKNSLRFASAEACAIALSQAAEAVASGESDIGDAVTEAGIVILPPPHDGHEGSSIEVGAEGNSFEVLDASEPEFHSAKWPRKPVLLDTNMFDAEDSWHDTTPEGFNLTLSPFATMWMALFGWVSAASLAYIYGQDESSQEEFLFVNGREYPCKTILPDGRSSEIKQTLAGCIARALPRLVSDLRLPTPVSSIEQFLGRLLDTMSFVDALPPFRTKQWHVIVLLFLDVLSVRRIPAISQYMTSKRMLLHKMLDAAQVSGEEYEVMKDLLIPLGRQPEFSAQSGG